jgi:N utilization substance protein A
MERQSGAIRHQRDGAGRSAVDHHGRGKALDGYRGRRGQALAGNRARRPERAPGQQTHRLAAQRDDQDQVAQKSEAEQEAARKLFQDKLEVDAEIAGILVQEGFTTVEEIAYVPTGELLAIEGFDENIVEELRARARDALLTEALAVEEDIEDNKPAEDLLGVEGMDETTAFALAEHAVVTRENLADLATDELMEFAIDGMDEDRAAALIMAARAGQTA